jgi:hypothetical protein
MDTSVRTSERQRALSKEAFNSQYRIEVSLAVLELAETFTFDDLASAVNDMATASGVEPPSPTALRRELQRLRDVYGALERLPRVKGESVKREVRRPSALWDVCREVALRSQ